MKTIGIVAVLSALLTAGNAFAEANYPDQPLRIVVGFVAGGPADVVARMVGDKLIEAWGKPVVIENVTGSGGNMATERVAKAAPDGYTLLLGTSGPFVIHPSLYPKLPFDPVKDFAPITQLCFTANVLASTTMSRRRAWPSLPHSRARSPARSPLAPPASALPSISPASCSRPWPASTSSISPTAASRR